MDTMMEPELAQKVMAKSTELVDGIIRVGSESGQYTWLPDPTASGTIINADTFNEFCSKPLSRIVKGWRHDFKNPMVYHVCGDTIPVMKEMLKTGIDVLSIDHAVDIAEARKVAGKNAILFGNVHPITTLWNGTPDEVRKESLDCIEKAGADGRFILSGGCEVTRDTTVENVRAMVEVGEKYKYGA